MTSEPDIRYAIDGSVAVITWDMIGRRMNVLSPQVMEEFGAAVERALADSAVHGIVVTSGKPAFIAGADLTWVVRLAEQGLAAKTPAQRQSMFDGAMRLQDIFRRLETGGKPVAAAITGTAMGGGLELALACHRRFVVDDPRAQLGLPESKVGLLPGAGGTQRLTRMLGPVAALPLLLDGTPLRPREALARGIVDEVVPAEELLTRAKAWVAQASPEQAIKPWDKPGYTVPGADPRNSNGAVALSVLHARQRQHSFGNFPALDAIECAVYDGLLVPMDRALRIEVRYIVGLLIEPTARNMIRTNFINLQQANRLPARPAGVPRQTLKRVGVMGDSALAASLALTSARARLEVQWVAGEGDAGLSALRAQLQRQVDAGRQSAEGMASLLARIHSVADVAHLKDCDLIVVSSDGDALVSVGALASTGAVLAATTSSEPMQSRKALSAADDRFVGFHLFAPLERTATVEVVRLPKTSDGAFALALDYAQRIGKTPFAVGDGFGFYVSRVVGCYAAEGVSMVAEGVSPALIENAGRAASMMPPLAVADDLSLEWLMQLCERTRDGVAATSAGERLLAQMAGKLGRSGRSAGKGFYDYAADGSRHLWPGLQELATQHPDQPAASALRARLLDVQALEAVRCLEQGILREPADADVAALLGWGFARWSGGPLSYIDTLGLAAFVERCDAHAQRLGARFAVPSLLRSMVQHGRSFYPPLNAPSS